MPEIPNQRLQQALEDGVSAGVPYFNQPVYSGVARLFITAFFGECNIGMQITLMASRDS